MALLQLLLLPAVGLHARQTGERAGCLGQGIGRERGRSSRPGDDAVMN